MVVKTRARDLDKEFKVRAGQHPEAQPRVVVSVEVAPATYVCIDGLPVPIYVSITTQRNRERGGQRLLTRLLLCTS